MRQLIPAVLAAATAALLASCNGSAPSAPGPAGAVTEPALGGTSVSGLLSESALGLWDLTLDPAAATATLALRETRNAAATDDLYLLSIGNFLRPDSLRVRQVRRDGAELALTLDFTHPFAAPTNLGAPPSAVNRADLGIAGRIVLLADVPSSAGNSYFTAGAPVVLNSALAANADAYIAPAGLLTLGTVANTFPAWALVDESGPEGSRTNASNGGNPQGNYGMAGWNGLNMGSTLDQWSGYGVLHQGQTTRRELRLHLSALTGGPVSLPLAVLAKYNDPRGGATAAEKKANRLPPPGPDHTRFAYRMPHGSLDLERLTFLGADGSFIVDTASSATLGFHVVDWDATATETSLPDLAQDAAVTNVAIGESGAPTLAICIPGVIGDTAFTIEFDPLLDILHDDTTYGGDAAPDSGRPGDALCFAKLVSKGAGSGELAGTYTGVVRAVDVEQSLDTNAWQFPLDPDLNLLPGNHPQPVAYQVFQVELEPAVPAVSGFGNGWGGATTVRTYAVTADSTGAMYVSGYFASGSVDFGGGSPHPNLGSSDIFLFKLNADGSFAWDKIFGNTFAQIAWGLATDPSDNLIVTGQYRGDLDFGGGLRSAPTSNRIWIAKYAADGTYLWDVTPAGEGAANRGTKAATDAAGNVYIAAVWTSTTIDFGGGVRNIVGTGAEATVAKYTPAGAWVYDNYTQGNGADVFLAMDVAPTGEVWAGGYYTTACTLFGVVLPTPSGSDALVAKLNAAGNYAAHYIWSGTGTEHVYEVAVHPTSGEVLATGYFNSPALDLGMGPVGNAGTGNDAWAARLSSTGTPLWAAQYGSSSADDGYGVGWIPGTSDFIVSGRTGGLINYGLGPHTPPSFRSTYILRYNAANVLQWQSFLESVDFPGGSFQAQNGIDDMALDPAGNPLIVGYVHKHVDLDPGAGTFDVITPTVPAGVNNGYLSRVLASNGLWN